MGLAKDADSPTWISELYQILALLGVLVLLMLSRYLPAHWRWAPGLLALYRPLEIFIFAVSWALIHLSPVAAYKRSLVGFLVNLAEVVVAFAAAYLGFGCLAGIPTALYSSLRTFVTIGPSSTKEPPADACCGLLIAAQVVVGYFLAAIIIASVVGALGLRPEKRGQTTR